MRLLTICLSLALLCLCGCGGQGSGSTPTATPSSGPGKISPAFNLTAVDGSAVSFKPTENPNGDVTMLVFWSYSWDSNVKTLLARLSELHERYAPRGLRIIAVAYDEEPSNLRNFLSTNKTPFPVAVGVDSTYEKFGLKSIPTIIVVDKSGQIVKRWEGHYSTEEISTELSPYLPGRDGNSSP
jgi:alkyl hydroperoxide reductase subunit AhpC